MGTSRTSISTVTRRMSATRNLAFLSLVILAALSVVMASEVRVETQKEAPAKSPAVTRDHKYLSHVTLYIENEDGSKTPSGWSTRKEDGADVDRPFPFQPGVNLIEGWTEGVLQLKEGERALLHVPSDKGYRERSMGGPGQAFHIPANSNLLFDIEIIGKEGEQEL